MTKIKTDELVKMSQDHKAWHELVVTCFDNQPTTDREQE